ncbi:hypothetical protein ON010_g6210 [Phytophthora cinnamomi]|nr:hypothetical protein ON010_g6210 [Phytophthora cinnamomi]
MALPLDPRTKSSAKNFLRFPDTAEAGLHANDGQGAGEAAFSTRSPQAEGSSSSDNKADLIYGDAVSQPAAEKTADATLYAQADALVEEWLNFRIEWSDVAITQYPIKEEYEKVLPKLSMRDRKRNVYVWNVEQLCGHIDACRWFAEVSDK